MWLKESMESGKIKLQDIQIHKSVGAKLKIYDILDPATGEIFRFIEEIRIQNAEVVAGKGARKSLYENVREGLTEPYSGVVKKWQYCKGSALLDCGGEHRQAEFTGSNKNVSVGLNLK